MQEILVLMGATASGKTALLESLFGRRGELEGLAEVVSADSMQAYRGMDIGTAKPGPDLLSRIPHHLLDICDPDEQFTVADFVRLADVAIDEIIARGRRPVVAGGTGFYIRNLLLGLPGAPAASPAMRAAVAADLARLGPSALRAELASGDPASAARIHPNDHYRLARALEILRETGRPMAEFLPASMARHGLPEGGASRPRPSRRWLVVHYRRPREELARRITERVDLMLASGLAEEVAALAAAGYGADAPGMRAIGYAEFLELRREGLSGRSLLAAARERIIANSLKYAKRQETFFRGLVRALLDRGEARGVARGDPDEDDVFLIDRIDAKGPEADVARLAAIAGPSRA